VVLTEDSDEADRHSDLIAITVPWSQGRDEMHAIHAIRHPNP
jgi:hypothetical protein